MLYFQVEGPHQVEILWEEMFSINLTTDEDKTSDGFTVFVCRSDDVTRNLTIAAS